MTVYFDQTSGFKAARDGIEDYRYNSTLEDTKNQKKALDSVDKFANDLEGVLSTLESMYQSPRKGDCDGIKSFPVSSGRYRLFYKVRVHNGDFIITLLDIDDNRQSNLDRFPSHAMIEFDDED
jgi:hypothetical protein